MMVGLQKQVPCIRLHVDDADRHAESLRYIEILPAPVTPHVNANGRHSSPEFMEPDACAHAFKRLRNRFFAHFRKPPLPPNEMRLSCGAERDCSQTECYNTGATGVHRAPVTTGAGSFRRWLGCAPKTVARVRPYPGVSQPAPPALTK